MSRYFKNKFAEYSSESSKGIIVSDSNGTKIAEEYKEALLPIIDELEEFISKNWPKNRSDYSVYTGTSGLVVLYLLRYKKLGDGDALKKAEELLRPCLKSVGSRSRLTYLCGDGGPLTCAAIAASFGATSLGSPDVYVDKLLSLHTRVLPGTSQSLPDMPDELLYGRVGFLYCLLLLNTLKVCSDKVSPVIPVLVDAILKSGQNMVAQQNITGTPLMYEWHGKKYYGAAHGIAGILIILMQAREFLPPNALEELVRPSIDYLECQLFPSGNMPSSEGSSNGDKLVHWCHGAPGAVLLFAMASEVFNSSKYLQTAMKSASVVWQRGLLKKGYGLCHGASGNGYSLLYMYQVTRQPQYLYEACQFGSWCQEYGNHGCDTPDRPLSLFEGLAGNAHYLTDLLDPNKAAFPGLILPKV